MDHGTSAVAGAALASPAWLSYLQSSSETVGLVLPFLGAIWLIVQTWSKIKLTLKETIKETNED